MEYSAAATVVALMRAPYRRRSRSPISVTSCWIADLQTSCGLSTCGPYRNRTAMPLRMTCSYGVPAAGEPRRCWIRTTRTPSAPPAARRHF